MITVSFESHLQLHFAESVSHHITDEHSLYHILLITQVALLFSLVMKGYYRCSTITRLLGLCTVFVIMDNKQLDSVHWRYYIYFFYVFFFTLNQMPILPIKCFEASEKWWVTLWFLLNLRSLRIHPMPKISKVLLCKKFLPSDDNCEWNIYHVTVSNIKYLYSACALVLLLFWTRFMPQGTNKKQLNTDWHRGKKTTALLRAQQAVSVTVGRILTRSKPQTQKSDLHLTGPLWFTASLKKEYQPWIVQGKQYALTHLCISQSLLHLQRVSECLSVCRSVSHPEKTESVSLKEFGEYLCFK